MNFFCITVVVFTFISNFTDSHAWKQNFPLKSFKHKCLKPWIPPVKDRHTYSWQCTLYEYTLICTTQTSHTHFILGFKKAVKKHHSVLSVFSFAFRLSHAEAQPLSPGFISGCQHLTVKWIPLSLITLLSGYIPLWSSLYLIVRPLAYFFFLSCAFFFCCFSHL